MINLGSRKYLKLSIVIVILVILMSIISFIMFKYEVEGENKKNLPFLIEKISIVSTADGLKNEQNTEYLWSGEILQINDVYIKIAQNEEIKKILKSIKIDNIQIMQSPLKGNITISRIAKNEDTSNKYIIEDLNEIIFISDKVTSLENFTVANQGGVVGLRTINRDLGEYNSNELEINYDGRILNVENISKEEIKFQISFEIVIEILDGIKYSTKVQLELPTGDISNNGVEIAEFENVNNLIYKRF